VLVLEASPKSCEESPDWDRGRLPVDVAGRVPRRVARRKLPDAPMSPPHASCNTLGEVVNSSRVRICQDSLEKWPVAYQSQNQIRAGESEAAALQKERTRVSLENYARGTHEPITLGNP